MFVLTNVVKLSIPLVRSIYKKEEGIRNKEEGILCEIPNFLKKFGLWVGYAVFFEIVKQIVERSKFQL